MELPEHIRKQQEQLKKSIEDQQRKPKASHEELREKVDQHLGRTKPAESRLSTQAAQRVGFTGTDLPCDLAPSGEEMQQLASVVLSSSFVQRNVQYQSRLSTALFCYGSSHEVNAYAVDLPIDNVTTQPQIVLQLGFAIAARLTAEGLVQHFDELSRRSLAATSPLGSLLHSIGTAVMQHRGALPPDAAAQIYRRHAQMDDAAPIPAPDPVVQSYAAAIVTSVIAHEAGHIALGHTLATGDLPLEVSRNQEREADSFAASVLATSPSQEALFLGQVFTAILLTWQQYAWGDTEESTHPLAKERFENILRSHSAALKEMGKQYGLTEKFLRGLLPDGC